MFGSVKNISVNIIYRERYVYLDLVQDGAREIYDFFLNLTSMCIFGSGWAINLDYR